jgi:hypothetical protein
MLPPQDEAAFQAFMGFNPQVREWRRGFTAQYGEPPQIDGGDYDYRAAYMAGVRPQAVPGDTVPHWSSVGKSADHPTMWKQEFMSRFGVDPDTPGLQFTPEMQALVGQNIPRRGLF